MLAVLQWRVSNSSCAATALSIVGSLLSKDLFSFFSMNFWYSSLLKYSPTHSVENIVWAQETSEAMAGGRFEYTGNSRNLAIDLSCSQRILDSFISRTEGFLIRIFSH